MPAPEGACCSESRISDPAFPRLGDALGDIFTDRSEVPVPRSMKVSHCSWVKGASSASSKPGKRQSLIPPSIGSTGEENADLPEIFRKGLHGFLTRSRQRSRLGTSSRPSRRRRPPVSMRCFFSSGPNPGDRRRDFRRCDSTANSHSAAGFAANFRRITRTGSQGFFHSNRPPKTGVRSERPRMEPARQRTSMSTNDDLPEPGEPRRAKRG